MFISVSLRLCDWVYIDGAGGRRERWDVQWHCTDSAWLIIRPVLLLHRRRRTVGTVSQFMEMYLFPLRHDAREMI